MRPRRQGLQVSTFPFLAVLLCAMGSLILLMLVIDRRAKVVARTKALQAITRRQEEASQAVRARQAEWEQRRQQLRAQLALQKDEALGQLKNLEQKHDQQDNILQNERKAIVDLQTQIQQAEKTLGGERLQLEREQTALRAPDTRIQGSQIEMGKLSAELLQLERTLGDLQAARKLDTRLFSVVPYQGKRGDNRRPIYLECQAAAVVIHPERVTLAGIGRSMQALRDEVERRIPKNSVKKTEGEDKASSPAYLMFLVRPDGIASYYQSMAALQGLPVDFGYEFVDADWVLDFPADDQTPGNQSWMVAKPSPIPIESAPSLRPRTAAPRGSGAWPGDNNAGISGPGSNGSEPSRNAAASANGVPGSKPGDGPSRMPPWSGAGNQRLPVFGGGSESKASSPGFAGLVPGGSNGGTPSGSGPWPGPVGQGVSSSTYGSSSQTAGRSGPGEGAATFTPGDGAAGPGIVGSTIPGRPQGLGSGQAGDTASASGLAELRAPSSLNPTEAGTQGGGGMRSAKGAGPSVTPLMPTRLGETGASGPVLDPPFAADGRGGNPLPSVQGSTISAPGSGLNAQGSNLPASALGSAPSAGSGNAGVQSAGPNSGQTVASNASPAPSGSGGSLANGQTGANASAAEESGSEPGPGVRRDPLSNLSGSGAAKTKNRERAGGPPVILTGNRDWVITLECNKNSLEIVPTRQSFSLEDIRQSGSEENHLLKAMQALIQRRQATVRPGEPPYRPMLRFRIRSGGLRIYYLAYPILEVLQLPMSHENLEHEDAIKSQRLLRQDG